MQEIIVYRNPVEAAFWSSMQDGNIVLFLVTFMIMAVSLVVMLVAIYNTVIVNKRVRTKWIYVPVVLGILISMITCYNLFL
ncbi:hypothetical protein EST35_0384 [Pseudomonas phage vB_PaeM_PA5oct]|uniref:Uncharacterized protein n=1 Tax=Pseudomonas phage vB_PaeM_PA5oct TaxID=2163605 RepID=A0A4Y5JUH5_9CAUD|nr:hypothetical protein PQE65_gp101 [Pseudomonas phage vB_PaeM_PA5oct]QCG76264.1 hypothetical protein EST35_0384 [Pseudomonas phage vB_PaeM_PA5oct]